MSIQREAFDDYHLTWDQKRKFWSWKFDGVVSGKRCKGTILQLAEEPELAEMIYSSYHAYCKSWLPDDEKEDERLILPLLSDPTGTECVCGATITANDHGFCTPCFLYFIVTAKVCGLKEQHAAIVRARSPAKKEQLLPSPVLTENGGDVAILGSAKVISSGQSKENAINLCSPPASPSAASPQVNPRKRKHTEPPIVHLPWRHDCKRRKV